MYITASRIEFDMGMMITSRPYHACMQEGTRYAREWEEGLHDLLVTTPALSAGIDKSDVRLAVHMDVPASLNAFIQERGRVGRDGQGGTNYVILSVDAILTRLRQSARSEFHNHCAQLVGNHLKSFVDTIYTFSSTKCIFQSLCEYLDVGDTVGGGDLACDGACTPCALGNAGHEYTGIAEAILTLVKDLDAGQVSKDKSC